MDEAATLIQAGARWPGATAAMDAVNAESAPADDDRTLLTHRAANPPAAADDKTQLRRDSRPAAAIPTAADAATVLTGAAGSGPTRGPASAPLGSAPEATVAAPRPAPTRLTGPAAALDDLRTIPTGAGTTSTGGGRTIVPHPGNRPIDVGDALNGRFLLVDVVAAGGMGVVYKAKDLVKEKGGVRDPYLALKMLGGDFKPHPDAWKALLSETEKTRNLMHPNIIRVYDFDHDPAWDEYFMTMEFLQGQSLESLIKKSKGLPVEPAALCFRVIEGIARALDYAHKHKPVIVHSDIKPSNVFITTEEVVKVLDFGIARVVRMGESQSEHTVFGVESLNAYTVAYASCEIMEGWPPHPADDVFALACIAYKLLAGRHPFGVDGERYGARFARDSGLVPEPIKGLDARQWKGLLRGLAFARKDRTPSVEQFLEEILPRTMPQRNKLAIGGAATAVAGLIAAAVFFGGQQGVAPPEVKNVKEPAREEPAPPKGTAETPKVTPPPETAPSKPPPTVAVTPPPPPPPVEETPGVPKTPEQQLLELIPRLGSLPMHLPKTVFRKKEAIPLSIDVAAPGNLHVFYFQPGEPVALVFPNGAANNNRVEAGIKPIEKLVATPPYGELSFIAIAEPEAENLFQFYAKDKSRVKSGFAILSAQELLNLVREHVNDPKAVIGHVNLTVVP